MSLIQIPDEALNVFSLSGTEQNAVIAGTFHLRSKKDVNKFVDRIIDKLS